jgi:hypothetical protein
MHRKKLMTKLASGSAAALLALGAAACDAEDDAAPGQEAPEGDFETEGDVEGDLEGDAEGDLDGGDEDFEEDGDIGEDF